MTTVGAGREPGRGGPYLGCVADDLTGATDLAGNLVRAGHRTTLTVGLPGLEGSPEADADAAVVALKTRTAPRDTAVAAARQAQQRLASWGCRRYWFKYCSTFDSTPDGNIGPVTDALLDACGGPWTVVCPAYPRNGRTVYQGHLFVGDRLLSESGMRHHPLTPMTDHDLVRLMSAQTRHRVGLLPHQVLRAGEGAVRTRLRALLEGGVRVVVTDAVADEDFPVIERVTRHLPLLTGGSGLALAVPRPRGGPAGAAGPANRIETAPGPGVVLAGSVSEATLGQTAHALGRLPHHKLSVQALLRDHEQAVAEAVTAARAHDGNRPFLIYSATDRAEVREAQRRFGTAEAAVAVERGMAACARALFAAGTRRAVVAGGETSGAVVSALGIERLRIGPVIAPGVPWTSARWRGRSVNLALKSGNFGNQDLFVTAARAL